MACIENNNCLEKFASPFDAKRSFHGWNKTEWGSDKAPRRIKLFITHPGHWGWNLKSKGSLDFSGPDYMILQFHASQGIQGPFEMWKKGIRLPLLGGFIKLPLARPQSSHNLSPWRAGCALAVRVMRRLGLSSTAFFNFPIFTDWRGWLYTG